MKDEDPKRLSVASDDPLLRELLGEGKRELPDAQQMASMLAKLGPAIGDGGDGGGGDGGGGAGPHGSSLAPPAGATAGALFGGVTGAKVVAVVVALAAAGWGMNALRDRAEIASRSPPTSPAPSVPPAPVVANTPESSAEPPVAVPLPPVAASGSPTPVSVLKPSAAASASAAPPPARLPSVHDSTDEVALLERAQDALAGNPTAALSLADEDVRRFPEGLLRQEAEVIAIDALARSGKRAAAEARANRFRAAYPASTHLRRIETLLERAR